MAKNITISFLNYFTCEYLIFLFITFLISNIFEKYDFLLGVFIFTMPVFITNLLWINKNCRVKNMSNEVTVILDIITHFFPFAIFIYILFFTNLKIHNKLIFWLGFISVFFLSGVYLYFHIDKIDKIYKNSHPILTFSVFGFSTIICTIFIYLKLK